MLKYFEEMFGFNVGYYDNFKIIACETASYV